MMSRIKINFRKSELLYFGRAGEVQSDYIQLYGYEIGSLLFTYLGIPIYHRKITNKRREMHWGLVGEKAKFLEG
jgi:hypothetical protein